MSLIRGDVILEHTDKSKPPVVRVDGNLLDVTRLQYIYNKDEEVNTMAVEGYLPGDTEPVKMFVNFRRFV